MVAETPAYMHIVPNDSLLGSLIIGLAVAIELDKRI